MPAAAAAIMACAGLFGVISYSVNQRMREFGIRLALGAPPAHLARLVLRMGLARTGIGIALGVGGALALSRLVDSLLFGIAASDPLTFVLVTLLLGAVSVMACWLPMRRAARLDPTEALRCE